MHPSSANQPSVQSDSNLESINLAASFQNLGLYSDWNKVSPHPYQPFNSFKDNQTPYFFHSPPANQQPVSPQSPLPNHFHHPHLTEPSSHLPTEAELSRRARAAAGLNVSAPEFVPSFATQPQPHHAELEEYQPEQYSEHPSLYQPQFTAQYPTDQSIDSPLSFQEPSFFNVYTNVVDYEPLGLPMTPQADPVSQEQAVDAFDRQFPALPSAAPAPKEVKPRTTGAQALGWEALQRREAQKVEAETKQREFEALQFAIDQLVADETEQPEVDVSNDIGDVWVTSGNNVAQLYQELRAEASVQASIRNKYFDRATTAFKRGDGATAKKLSALGREANDHMKELHQKAANAIFEARNPPSATDVIDLHGLHVSEAVERLPDALARAPEGSIRILTGTGHHTKGTGRARLRPAVKKWLQDNSYYFSEVVDANDYVGSFIVDVKR